MVLPQWFVKGVLTEFYDGPPGGHFKIDEIEKSKYQVLKTFLIWQKQCTGTEAVV